MRIGVPKEIKNHEYHVGLSPAGGGLQAHAGRVTHRDLAADAGRPYVSAAEALA